MSAGNLDIYIKVHGSERLRLTGDEEKISLDVELVVISGGHTVPGQPVELSMNGKTHRLATLENGTLRAELIFPGRAGNGFVHRLEALAEGRHIPPAACSIDVVLPDEAEKNSDAGGMRETLPEDVLNGRGSIQRGQIITLNGGFYDVAHDIVVERGGKLVIRPACTLEFAEGAGIRCEGVIEAIGSEEEKITFTAQRSHWNNILFYGRHTSGSRMEHCLIEHGSGRALETDGQRGVLLPVNSPGDSAGSGSQRHGGGLQLLYTHHAQLIFNSLLIRENAANNGYGGGIYIDGSAPVVTHSRVIQNEASHGGGGIYVTGPDAAEARFTSLDIYNNKSPGDGGGLYFDGVSPRFNDSEIHDNDARFGGGLYHNELAPEDLEISNCRFHENLSRGTPDDTEGVSGSWPG
ncbi:MAG: hypothetical protein GY940_00575 [bacterium]|nr:hypothetical protein [bacterium]